MQTFFNLGTSLPLQDGSVQKFGPLKKLNTPSGAWTNIFLSHPMKQSGMLVAVEYYSYNQGEFFIGGWRREATNLTEIERAWEIKISCPRPGVNFRVSSYTEH